LLCITLINRTHCWSGKVVPGKRKIFIHYLYHQCCHLGFLTSWPGNKFEDTLSRSFFRFSYLTFVEDDVVSSKSGIEWVNHVKNSPKILQCWDSDKFNDISSWVSPWLAPPTIHIPLWLFLFFYDDLGCEGLISFIRPIDFWLKIPFWAALFTRNTTCTVQ
jgi:hypothetical protein